MCLFLFVHIKIKPQNHPHGADMWRSARLVGVERVEGVSDNIRDSVIVDHTSG